MSVKVNAPLVLRFTASACPERHLAAAGWLGAEIGRDQLGELFQDALSYW